MSETSPVNQLPHHFQQPLCTTRECYRQGRKLTAIKVYTVNDESRHLLVHGVPAIAIHDELGNLCQKFGELETFVKQPDYPREEFTDVYQVTYKRLSTARFAKRQLDNRNYFGGILHVCYAPELESVDDTKAKLLDRRKAIELRTSNVSVPQSQRHNPGYGNRNLKRNAPQDLLPPTAKRSTFQNCCDSEFSQSSLGAATSVLQDSSKAIQGSFGSHSVPARACSTSTTSTKSIRLAPRQIYVKRIVFKLPKNSYPSSTADKPGSSEGGTT